MAAGKFVLLLVAGGLAGAAFAGMTSGVMRPYRDHETAAPIRPVPQSAESAQTEAPYAAPARPSWLEEGMAMLDSSAWPFDHGADPEAEQGDRAPEDYEDYPPYASLPRDRYADDDYHARHEERFGGRGYRRFDGYEPDAYPHAYADVPERSERLQRPSPRQDDAAADAASRAADAAQDVMAAESGH